MYTNKAIQENAIRLHRCADSSSGPVMDCSFNTGHPAENAVEIQIPDHSPMIARLTNCYLQAFRAAKNQDYHSIILPLFGMADGIWSLEESLHSLKHALMIFWRSGALDGEDFLDMDLYLIPGGKSSEREIDRLCRSAFATFLCDLKDWNSKGDRRMWEHLMHIFAERDVETEDEFIAMILSEYKDLTGSLPKDLPGRDPVYVPSLDFGAGGGFVSDDFWITTALPLLKNRFQS